jgi:hypothetical protein
MGVVSNFMQCVEVLSEDQKIHDILWIRALDAVRKEDNAIPITN